MNTEGRLNKLSERLERTIQILNEQKRENLITRQAFLDLCAFLTQKKVIDKDELNAFLIARNTPKPNLKFQESKEAYEKATGKVSGANIGKTEAMLPSGPATS